MTGTHISPDEIGVVAAGLADAEMSRHVAECAACAAKVEALESAVSQFAIALRVDAERPEAQWARQRQAIASAIGRRSKRAVIFEWATATAALVVVAFALVLASPRHVAVTHRPPVAQVPNDPDALLDAVAEDLQRDAPEALAPASLLVQEHDRIESMAATRSAGRVQGDKND